jgi:hypothetical protein
MLSTGICSFCCEEPETIKINHPEKDETMVVEKAKYVRAQTRALQEYGYSDLTEAHVSGQIDKALKGEKLDVIGMFIEKDLVK